MVREFQRRDLITAGCTFTGYLFVHLLLNGVFTIESIETTLPLSAGVAVPFGVVLGIPGIVGLAFGTFLSDLLVGTLSIAAILFSTSVVLLAYFSLYTYEVWDQSSPDATPLRVVVRLALVAGIACCGGAAFLGLGYQMAGIAPFYVSTVFALLQFLVATAVIAPVVGLIAVLGDRFSEHRIVRSGTVASPAPRHGWSLLVVPPLWVLFGTIGSFGFKLRERVSLSGFQNFDVEFLYYLVHPDIFGQGGRRAQVVLGVVALLVIFDATRRMDRRPGGAR